MEAAHMYRMQIQATMMLHNYSSKGKYCRSNWKLSNQRKRIVRRNRTLLLGK